MSPGTYRLEYLRSYALCAFLPSWEAFASAALKGLVCIQGRALGLSGPLRASVRRPSPKIRVRIVRPEVGKEPVSSGSCEGSHQEAYRYPDCRPSESTKVSPRSPITFSAPTTCQVHVVPQRGFGSHKTKRCESLQEREMGMLKTSVNGCCRLGTRRLVTYMRSRSRNTRRKYRRLSTRWQICRCVSQHHWRSPPANWLAVPAWPLMFLRF
jgi:hypothetical protein